jgi:hypothetical protein
VVRIVSGSGKLRLRSQSSLYIFQETQGQHVLKPSNICAYANRCAHGYLIEIAGQCDVGTLEEARATNDANTAYLKVRRAILNSGFPSNEIGS